MHWSILTCRDRRRANLSGPAPRWPQPELDRAGLLAALGRFRAFQRSGRIDQVPRARNAEPGHQLHVRGAPQRNCLCKPDRAGLGQPSSAPASIALHHRDLDPSRLGQEFQIARHRRLVQSGLVRQGAQRVVVGDCHQAQQAELGAGQAARRQAAVEQTRDATRGEAAVPAGINLERVACVGAKGSRGSCRCYRTMP